MIGEETWQSIYNVKMSIHIKKALEGTFQRSRNNYNAELKEYEHVDFFLPFFFNHYMHTFYIVPKIQGGRGLYEGINTYSCVYILYIENY